MTHQDFIIIARTLTKCRMYMAPAAYHTTVEMFATELQAESPSFNLGKFLKACYTNTQGATT